MSFPIKGPIAPENNPSPVPQFFRPGVYYITSVAQGVSTTITTNVANQYVIGQLVRFAVPIFYRMYQLDNLEAYVESISSPTTFTVGIDSTTFNPFNPSPRYGPTQPQVMAIGDLNTGTLNSAGRISQGTTIPGAYINTSPIEGTWLN